jgi:predicted RNA-binding protein with PIN domain
VPTHLLIDGYNLLKRSSISALFDATDLDSARSYLLERLFEYKRGKRIRITVVFDAPLGLSLARTIENHKGIEVIYSKQGESADQVIVKVIRGPQSGLVVVTSDRAIIDEAKKRGVAFITPDRLESSMDGERDGDPEGRRTEKKGNPRKAPKSLRKARRAIKKIL